MFGQKGFLKTGVSAGDREKSVPAVQNGEPWSFPLLTHPPGSQKYTIYYLSL